MSGNYHCTSLLENQNGWLQNPGNFSGGLIFRNAVGNVVLHMSTNSVTRIKDEFVPETAVIGLNSNQLSSPF